MEYREQGGDVRQYRSRGKVPIILPKPDGAASLNIGREGHCDVKRSYQSRE
jgi:hypothetical protein